MARFLSVSFYMVSNYLSPSDIATKKELREKPKEEISMPIMVSMYNYHMGGVDISDQRKKTYEIDHRSRHKYYLRLFWDQLDTVVCNSFIIYKQLTGENISFKDFRLATVNQLVNHYCSRLKQPAACSKSKKRKIDGEAALTHLPKGDATRNRCAYCSTKTNDCCSNISCTNCNISLCLNSQKKLLHELSCK